MIYLLPVCLVGIVLSAIGYARSRPEKELAVTIDWSPDHNLVIPQGPIYTQHKRSELVREIQDLKGVRADLREELHEALIQVEQLRLQLAKQTMLKKRYWRVLRKEGLR
jgi:hypothetical protein